MKKHFGAFFLITALAACSSGESSNGTSPDKPLDPVVASNPPTAQPIIDNEDMTPGLAGVDADKNGIRDDIDRLIAKKYASTPEIKRATEQVARSLQIFMEATTRQQALAAGDENARALECLWSKFVTPNSKNTQLAVAASKEIEALTANTKERFTKYWSSNKLVGGGYFSQPVGPVCD